MTAEYKRTIAGVAAVLAALWVAEAGANSAATFDCVIQPTEFVELSSSVPGIIDTIAVDRSDPVEKGQEVARLKSDVEQAQVDLSKQRAGFDSEIESKRASLAFARRSQQRTQKLFNKKAVPFHVLDEAKTDAILAATELSTAQQNKRMAELELERAEATLALRTVRSPISGVVVERLKAPGDRSARSSAGRGYRAGGQVRHYQGRHARRSDPGARQEAQIHRPGNHRRQGGGRSQRHLRRAPRAPQSR
jgi:multidrug resistance efflux pump